MKRPGIAGYLVCTIAILVLSGCGSSTTSTPPAHTSGRAYAGQTVTALIAYPSPPASALQQFTKQTGIKVKWTNVDWDSLQTKITAAMSAHVYFADVTDVDWSRVGQYHILKWFVPLNRYFSPASLRSDMPQLPAFMVSGQLVGMPFDASYMVTTVNTADFHRAGITAMPTTFAAYNSDLHKLQTSGVMAHPLGIPLSAQEGLSTYWYELTGALGGQVLSPSLKPEFTSPSSAGYRALAWIVNAYKSGLVPKANIDMSDTDEMQNEMAHNKVATLFSDYAGQVTTIYDVPGSSSVVGKVQYISTPGQAGNGPNLDNPDGIGIPTTAHHVGAAAEFIKWFTSTKNQARWGGYDGPKNVVVGFPLPARISSLNMLAHAKKVAQGQELATLLKTRSRPVFPNGPPSNYAQFSAAVNTNIHAAALGSETVTQAIQRIAAAAHP